MIELITGADGTAHVSSADDGALYASIVGTGSYSGKGVGEGLSLSVRDNNHLTLGTGCGWHNGRGWRVTSQHDVVVQSGTQAQRRADLVVARYSVEGDREKMEVVTLKGEPVADSAEPEYPAHEEGSVLDGARVSDMPLYGVKLNGLNVEGTERMFTELPSLTDLLGLVMAAQSSIKELEKRAGEIEKKNALQDTAIGGKAPTAHASTGTGYGAGSGSNYGHVKLSDSTTSASGAGGGIAATPAAVKAVKDSLTQGVLYRGGGFTVWRFGPVLGVNALNVTTGSDSWAVTSCAYTVPKGLRPKSTVHGAAIAQNGGSGTTVVSVDANGAISVRNQGSSGTSSARSGTVTWLAEA